MEHAYRRAGSGDFSGTVGALDRAIESSGLHVRAVRDVHVTLAAKGFPIRPVRIYEIAAAERPRPAVPPACTLLVDEEDGRVWVTILRAEMAGEYWARLGTDGRRGAWAEHARRVEERLVAVIDKALG